MYIEAIGAITSLGHDARRTVASLRSGLESFREIPFWGESQLNLQAAPIVGFAEGLMGIRRYKALIRRALWPCLCEIPERERSKLLLFLGLPRFDRPGSPTAIIDPLRDWLSEWLQIQKERIYPVPWGRAAVFGALKETEPLLKRSDVLACIVGGVDSLVDPQSLAALSRARFLKEEYDGFIPGEAAAFVRIGKKPTLGCWGRDAVAIAGIGQAKESADGTKDHPLLGVGLSAAIIEALDGAGIPEGAVDVCINDVNGSRAAFEDDAHGRIRVFRTPGKYIDLWHTASYLGETGAAVGAIELIWASAALELGFTQSPLILASASEAHLRSAVVLRRQKGSASSIQAYPIQVGQGIPIVHQNLPQTHEHDIEDEGLRIADLDHGHQDLAQKNLDELCWLITTREYHHQSSGDPWADIEEFEQRLVTHLDALCWTDAESLKLAQAMLHSEEMDEVAAATLTLLSLPPQSQTKDAIIAVAQTSDDHCRTITGVLPHLAREHAEPILFSLTRSDNAVQAALAIRAMTVAGWITEETLKPYFFTKEPLLMSPLMEATGAFVLSPFGAMIDRLLQSHHQQLSPLDYLGALALSPRGKPLKGLDQKTFMLNAPKVFALWCLREGTSFIRQFPEDGALTPAMIEAIGTSGEHRAQSWLLASLEQGNPTQKTAAANALYRIYGCELFDESENSEEDSLEADLEETSTGNSPLPPAMIELASSVAKREAQTLSQDPAAWRVALEPFQNLGEAKLRFGHPWTPNSAWQALKRRELISLERYFAIWEWVIVHQRPLPLHPLWFVEKQLAQLEKCSC